MRKGTGKALGEEEGGIQGGIEGENEVGEDDEEEKGALVAVLSLALLEGREKEESQGEELGEVVSGHVDLSIRVIRDIQVNIVIGFISIQGTL